MQILYQYEKDGMNVIEYTKDGVTVSHVVKTPILQETEPIEPIETLEQKIERLEQQIQNDSMIQFEVLATIYEEILMKG